MGLYDCQIPEILDSEDYKVYENDMIENDSKEINELYQLLKFECSKTVYCFDISYEVKPTDNNYTDIRHYNENFLISKNFLK